MATSGVDWGQATKIGESLLISPVIGFAVSAILLLVSKAVVKDKRLYEAPVGNEPPPFWIRVLLFSLARASVSRMDRMTGKRAWA